MNAILFGNGFNMLSKGCPSWNKLLSDMSDSKNAPILDGIPPTLQYEQVYLSPNTSFSSLTSGTEETVLKKSVKRKLKNLSTNEFYLRLIELDADVYITTNYDHVFYDNKETQVVDKNNSERLYSIRRWKRINIGGKELILYNIHGDLTNVCSIMLGLDHYGGYLAKIQDYVKGTYKRTKKVHTSKQVFSVVPSISYRIKESSLKDLNHEDYGFTKSGTSLLSWIDAFFFADLHIIGLSLDFSEIDLWWLLSRRARLYKNRTDGNKVYYYHTFPLSEIHLHLPKLRLLEKLGVYVVYHKQTNDIETGKINYQEIYQEQLKNMKDHL